jgi:ATP-binding cassette subfamily F protein 3
MIQIRNLNLSFGDQKIFNNLNLNISEHDKIGLVGLNGSGKSTLLKAVSGEKNYDTGDIKITGNKKIGYIPQEVSLISDLSVIDEAISKIEILDETEIPKLQAEAKKILMGLGFTLEQISAPVNSLSVGWKMRLVIAQLIMQKADFYLFDEPTNHLDIITKKWFLDFLKNAEFGFLLVCHEKYFLDNLCSSIIELENGSGTFYKGNYSSYLIQKEENLERLEKAFNLQQREIAHKEALINKFKAKATKASFAKSLQKSLDKVERIELPNQAKAVDFKLPEIKPSGKIVLTIENLSHSFGSKKIFDKVNIELEKNEKCAIVAGNGVGKSTLLNIAMNKLDKQYGTISFGYNVSASFFEQDQVKVLNPEKTIFETIQENCSNVTDQEIRTMLGCFLFSKDLINKKIKVLSGGEKNRVSMAKVLLQNSNLLILDEPTNHLDIPSKEILLHALKNYKGTILFVSHDQDFINNLATHIIELTPNGTFKYKGNYESFLQHKEVLNNLNQNKINEHKASIIQTKHTTSQKNKPEQKKDLKKLENQIERLEKKIEELYLELSALKWSSPEHASKNSELVNAKLKLDELFKTWEDSQ